MSSFKLRQLVKYLSDSAGIEKALRLSQGLLMVFAAVSLWASSSSSPLLQDISFAKQIVTIARKFLRLYKWVECWSLAYTLLLAINRATLSPRALLTIGKWAVLGLYFFLETVILINTLRITKLSWIARVEDLALKSWFQGLCISVVLSLNEMSSLRYAAVRTRKADVTLQNPGIESTVGPTGANDQPVEPARPSNRRTRSSSPRHGKRQKPAPRYKIVKKRPNMLKRLVIDCCDLTVPAYGIGWIKVNPALIGLAIMVSSALSCSEIWRKVQVESGRGRK